jgi:hypothetical protein
VKFLSLLLILHYSFIFTIRSHKITAYFTVILQNYVYLIKFLNRYHTSLIDFPSHKFLNFNFLVQNNLQLSDQHAKPTAAPSSLMIESINLHIKVARGNVQQTANLLTDSGCSTLKPTTGDDLSRNTT